MHDLALEFIDLTLGYDSHPAVHHLQASIARGALVAIVGPNGAGKSTLLKGIAGSLSPLAGEIRMHGCRRRDIAYLPQIVDIDRSFPVSVFDLVSTGLWRELGALGGLSRTQRQRVGEALAAVGLAHFARRAIGSLSGGQLQRALFARLRLRDAPVIILDEPLASVDVETAQTLLDVIEQWHAEQRTVLAVLHDLDQIHRHFPETLLLSRELIAFGPTRETLQPSNMLRARQLTEAFDEQAQACRRRTPEAA
ncbi:MAG: ABC transporter ATP-binding protein [Gammaproteobacteria bacterium]|nr:ABC transporter ATP-binding protein [Gammaproteobacteria bacterium]